MDVKKAIESFKSYNANQKDYVVKLDANESIPNESIKISQNDLNKLNRYPDNLCLDLRQKIASYRNVSKEEVMVGAGSSELLELVVKTYTNPGDFILSVEPSFVMYQKYAMMHFGNYITVSSEDDYSIDISKIIRYAARMNPKIIFLCTPNNPTGYVIPRSEVIRLLENTNSLVVVDEAYMEFIKEAESVIDLINDFDNLIVNRTFSKAYGVAGARLGYFIANTKIIKQLSLIKTPYSVNSLSQLIGIKALEETTFLTNNIDRVITQREKLYKAMDNLPIKYYKSGANFIFCELTEFDLYERLAEKKVLIRSFNNGTYRITIGNEEDNNYLIKKLKEVFLYED